MAKPKLYGISGSRAVRSMWAIEEVGIEYEHVSVNFMEESKKPEYLAVNPNGRIPALQDGELTLFESMGVALEDIAAANLVYKKAKEQGIGQELPF